MTDDSCYPSLRIVTGSSGLIGAEVSIADTITRGEYWGTLARVCEERFLWHAETYPDVYGRPSPEFGRVKPYQSLSDRDGDDSPSWGTAEFVREHLDG